jgi:hypothetical protein
MGAEGARPETRGRRHVVPVWLPRSRYGVAARVRPYETDTKFITGIRTHVVSSPREHRTSVHSVMPRECRGGWHRRPVMPLRGRGGGASRRLLESRQSVRQTAAGSVSLSGCPCRAREGARAQVVRDVLREHSVKPRRVYHDPVIEALASDRADDAFHVRGLPR